MSAGNYIPCSAPGDSNARQVQIEHIRDVGKLGSLGIVTVRDVQLGHVGLVRDVGFVGYVGFLGDVGEQRHVGFVSHVGKQRLGRRPKLS
jgi:hypothetical protein